MLLVDLRAGTAGRKSLWQSWFSFSRPLERLRSMAIARAFDFITQPPGRSLTKPRASGLTMVIDQGLGLAAQRDLCETAGDYMDFAKFKTGQARLYREAHLLQKVRQYLESGVKPFIGGQFHEYVFAVHGAPALPVFYAEAKRVGFTTIEISDNIVPLTPKLRRDQIRGAVDAGLEVFGEVGSKDNQTSAAELIDQAGVCFDAGASLVLVEAAELVTAGKPNQAMLDELTGHLDMKRVMIELPGPWIPDVRTCDIELLKKLLVAALGPDVNVANVMPDTVIDFEATRVGLGAAGPQNFVRGHGGA
jgi:phosphosulfolactate synthase